MIFDDLRLHSMLNLSIIYKYVAQIHIFFHSAWAAATLIAA